MTTIGFIGLGRMGENMVLNLLDNKKKVVVYDLSKRSIKKLQKKGAKGAFSVDELFQKLPKRKIIWLMIPSGKPTEELVETLSNRLSKGDVLIDGGNSHYKDSQHRYNLLKKKGISYLDVGTSGGVSGARYGACMMIGGDKTTYELIKPFLEVMCVKDGYGYMGKSGAGHFVKGVHNGIEYGMLGAIAEGMQAIKKESKKLGTNMQEVAKVYAHGSIIESRLMSWTESGLKRKDFKKLSGRVPKGETEEEMKELGKEYSLPLLDAARKAREKTRKSPSYAGKVTTIVRNEFGGHKIK